MKPKMKIGRFLSSLFVLSILPLSVFAAVGVSEVVLEMPTCPYGDPDPVPDTDTQLYPYFFFDETTKAESVQSWRAVVLENDRIKLTVIPGIGGKIWGATDKITGRDFIYHNHSVKFRNIAMRGPWCSGGIEFNFGIIGHAPWTAAPVSYFVRTNSDESVSCFLSESEFIGGTTWQVEVNVPKTGDRFLTRTTWYNGSLFSAPYYQWMNAAYSVRGDPEFVFPADNHVFHDGEPFTWPVDAEGRDLSTYAANAFGRDKSNHYICGDNSFYGIWWREYGLGSAHRTHVSEKYGRKLFLWAQSRLGAIWEDLLTDGDGQYAELQSGRAFNQPGFDSYLTPFKHLSFAPGVTDSFEEEWSVVRDRAEFDKALASRENYIERPLNFPTNFNWKSLYGTYIEADQNLNQKRLAEAEKLYLKTLEMDEFYLPSLCRMSSLCVRRGEFARAREFAARAMSLDTYAPEANYADGLAALALGNRRLARERLGLAAYSPEYRAAANVWISKIELADGDAETAARFARKALDADAGNMDAKLLLIVSARKSGRNDLARQLAVETLGTLPLLHAARRELNLVDPSSAPFADFIRNEMPHETIVSIADWYESCGLPEDAEAVLSALQSVSPAPRVIPVLRLAYVKHLLGKTAEAEALLSDAAKMPLAFAMPFRVSTMPALDFAIAGNGSWKFRYLKAVLLYALHRDGEGRALLADCGDEPDDEVFYLFRNRHFRLPGAEKAGPEVRDNLPRHLARALSLPHTWRTDYAAYSHYASVSNWPAALAALERSTTNLCSAANLIKLAYANALVMNGMDEETIGYLNRTEMMPSEGGDNAGDSWFRAWGDMARKALAAKDEAKAEGFIRTALTYPERLGLGRPYDLDEKRFTEDCGWDEPLLVIARRIWKEGE